MPQTPGLGRHTHERPQEPLAEGLGMILAVDAKYSEKYAAVAGILFEDWRDHVPRMELISCIEVPAAYEPGQLYKKRAALHSEAHRRKRIEPDCIIVDGYVYLEGSGKAGLGKRLYDALSGKVPVIGVAKNRFKNIGPEYEVRRGTSNRPLYITAAGIELETAKELIRTMHGNYRQPALLKRADRVSRDIRC